MATAGHESRISISSTLSDDLQVYSAPDLYAYGPQVDPFSDTGGSPRNSFNAGHRAASSSASTKHHGRSESQASNMTGKRSRARAFSFLLESASPEISFLSPNPNSNPRSPNLTDSFSRRASDVPFGSPEYNDALAPAEDEGEDEDDDGIELQTMGKVERGRDAYRQTFQGVTPQEYWWMGASALAVLGLTAGAIVITVIG